VEQTREAGKRGTGWRSYPLTLGAAVSTQLNEALLAQERLPQQNGNQNRTGIGIRIRTRIRTKTNPIRNHNHSHSQNQTKPNRTKTITEPNTQRTHRGLCMFFRRVVVFGGGDGSGGSGVSKVWWCRWGSVVLV